MGLSMRRKNARHVILRPFSTSRRISGQIPCAPDPGTVASARTGRIVTSAATAGPSVPLAGVLPRVPDVHPVRLPRFGLLSPAGRLQGLGLVLLAPRRVAFLLGTVLLRLRTW